MDALAKMPRDQFVTLRIRGISKTQVERQLGTQLLSSEIATSFSEIGKALS